MLMETFIWNSKHVRGVEYDVEWEGEDLEQVSCLCLSDVLLLKLKLTKKQ